MAEQATYGILRRYWLDNVEKPRKEPTLDERHLSLPITENRRSRRTLRHADGERWVYGYSRIGWRREVYRGSLSLLYSQSFRYIEFVLAIEIKLHRVDINH